jgi:hypothetical protein
LGPRLHRRLLAAAAGICALAVLAGPTAASAAPVSLTSSQSALSGATIALDAPDSPEILDSVVLHGRVAFAGPRQRATVTVRSEGRPVLRRSVRVHPVTGRYRTRMRLKACCSYIAQVERGSDVSYPLGFSVGVPETLDKWRHARLFNQLLRAAGYHMGEEPVADYADERTGLAVMAMRKVHDMERTEEYDPALFKTLLKGEGQFEPEHTEDGRHVEVDVSRQVMALVEDGVATDVFHVSTGAGGTPSGEWTFYSKTPGYNAKGMYYSSFYDGNYATHGFESVPTYPASHGCTRNPPPYSIFIYDWIELGETKMYVYA